MALARSLALQPIAPSRPSAPAAAGLTAVERTVVALAVADASHNRAPDWGRGARLRRLVDLLLGRRPTRMLADPRLEALRRFTFLAAHGGERIADMRVLRDAGFSPAQIVLAARLSRLRQTR